MQILDSVLRVGPVKPCVATDDDPSTRVSDTAVPTLPACSPDFVSAISVSNINSFRSFSESSVPSACAGARPHLPRRKCPSSLLKRSLHPVIGGSRPLKPHSLCPSSASVGSFAVSRTLSQVCDAHKRMSLCFPSSRLHLPGFSSQITPCFCPQEAALKRSWLSLVVEKSGFRISLIQDSNDVLCALHPRPTLDVLPCLFLPLLFRVACARGRRSNSLVVDGPGGSGLRTPGVHI